DAPSELARAAWRDSQRQSGAAMGEHPAQGTSPVWTETLEPKRSGLKKVGIALVIAAIVIVAAGIAVLSFGKADPAAASGASAVVAQASAPIAAAPASKGESLAPPPAMPSRVDPSPAVEPAPPETIASATPVVRRSEADRIVAPVRRPSPTRPTAPRPPSKSHDDPTEGRF
ncbi:MAG TPA: hypothetical protein VJT73_15115, partial [Polyangiaceae bacterium]|nr:hypothetical protein [Polyangiaceae bacterium]